MKRLIVFTGLIGLFLLFPVSASADCIAPDTSGNCSASRLACSAINDYGVSYTTCCSTQGECSAVSTPPSALTTQTQAAPPPNKQVCEFAGAGQGDCNACMADGQHSWTAIGCISATPAGIFERFFAIGTGIAGGIAFLLILLGSFQMMTSAGNPEQLNAGKELVTSAVIGLLLIIFSVFLLKIIGVNILGIPGFS